MKRMVICLVLFFSLLSVPHASNQAAAQNLTDLPVLKLKLITTTPVVCFGGTTRLKARLINESNDKVAIDINTIWYEISFRFFRESSSQTKPDRSGSGRNKGGSLTQVGDPGPNYEGKYLVLDTGQSYTATNALKLDDQFFKEPGVYKIKVTYGQFLKNAVEGTSVWKGTAESNELALRIIACNVSRTRKTSKKTYRKPLG